jgi:hypothetical protein
MCSVSIFAKAPQSLGNWMCFVSSLAKALSVWESRCVLFLVSRNHHNVWETGCVLCLVSRKHHTVWETGCVLCLVSRKHHIVWETGCVPILRWNAVDVPAEIGRTARTVFRPSYASRNYMILK